MAYKRALCKNDTVSVRRCPNMTVKRITSLFAVRIPVALAGCPTSSLFSPISPRVSSTCCRHMEGLRPRRMDGTALSAHFNLGHLSGSHTEAKREGVEKRAFTEPKAASLILPAKMRGVLWPVYDV